MAKDGRDQNQSMSAGGGSAVESHLSQMSGGGINQQAAQANANSPEKAEIDYGLSAVAKNPKKSMVTMIVFLVIVGIAAYYFLFDDDKSKNTTTQDPTSINADVAPSSEPNDIPIPSIPSGNIAPPPPPEEQTSTPLTPPPGPSAADDKKDATPPAAKPPAPNFENQAMEQQKIANEMRAKQEEQKRAQQRITSGIMVQGGKSSGKDAQQSQAQLASNGDFLPQQTAATQTQITKMGNLSTMIAQGKIIDTVLESTIVSSYPGTVRALITMDVFSEKGENVLIPKGSRLLGTFSSGFAAGQNRVNIVWNRLIMPNGYDISVDSQSIGPEGIIGVEGEVHTEIGKTLTNALLVSAINIAFTEAANKLTNTKPQSQTTTTSSSGDITNTSVNDPTRDAITSASNSFNQSIQSFVQQNFIVQPFISIQHGTRVKVFVNKDLLFPSNLANGVNFIQ